MTRRVVQSYKDLPEEEAPMTSWDWFRANAYCQNIIKPSQWQGSDSPKIPPWGRLNQCHWNQWTDKWGRHLLLLLLLFYEESKLIPVKLLSELDVSALIFPYSPQVDSQSSRAEHTEQRFWECQVFSHLSTSVYKTIRPHFSLCKGSVLNHIWNESRCSLLTFCQTVLCSAHSK